MGFSESLFSLAHIYMIHQRRSMLRKKNTTPEHLGKIKPTAHWPHTGHLTNANEQKPSATPKTKSIARWQHTEALRYSERIRCAEVKGKAEISLIHPFSDAVIAPMIIANQRFQNSEIPPTQSADKGYEASFCGVLEYIRVRRDAMAIQFIKIFLYFKRVFLLRTPLYYIINIALINAVSGGPRKVYEGTSKNRAVALSILKVVGGLPFNQNFGMWMGRPCFYNTWYVFLYGFVF